MAFNNLPISVTYVLKVFYAMVTDQALDQNKDFVKVINPSEASQFDSKKLSYKFQQMFLGGFQPKSMNEIISEFDPLKLSEGTVKYLKRVRIETLEGPEPQVTEHKIQMTSHMAHKLWNWCKCMFAIRKKVLLDEDWIFNDNDKKSDSCFVLMWLINKFLKNFIKEKISRIYNVDWQ